MTLFWLKKTITSCLVLGLVACQGNDSLTQTSVPSETQTIELAVTKPIMPKGIVKLPSFAEAIPDAGLAEFTHDFVDAADPEWDKALEMRGVKGHAKLVSELLRAAKLRLVGAANFSKKAASVLSQGGFDPQTAEPVSASLTQNRLFGIEGDWLVQAEKEQGSEQALRFFYNNDEQTVATFLASAIHDSVAQKGLWAFVNPILLEKTTEIGQRAFIMAYDVTHPERTLFVVREEKAMLEHPSILTELHVQCDVMAGECLAEVLRADGTPGSLSVTGSLRMSWNNSTQKICLQESKPGETSFETATDLEGNVCETSEPAWGTQPLFDEDLLLGFFDTEPPGGDAALILLDGQTRDGWLSLSENLIDGWLTGMSL